jgi:hypothetical protein
MAVSFLLTLSSCAGPHPPLARITGACVLLASPQAALYLGDDLVPVEHNYGGLTETLYSCDFTRGDRLVLSLTVQEVADRRRQPKDYIENIRRRNRVQTPAATGVGDAAVFYLRGSGFGVFVTAKRAGANIRLATFDANESFSPSRLATLASMVMDQF